MAEFYPEILMPVLMALGFVGFFGAVLVEFMASPKLDRIIDPWIKKISDRRKIVIARDSK